jgi:GH24 family phage-related lysozyme (muramidase)
MTLLDRAWLHIPPFEGSVPHLYLDTKGLVTVGVGCMLATLPDAQRLPFVPAAAVVDDWIRVRKARPGLPAHTYKPLTRAVLPVDCILKLFNSRCLSFLAALRKAQPAFDTFPAGVQLALLDMAFNLGAGALTNKWPSLMKACREKNWAAAAVQCTRVGVQPARNAATIALFKEPPHV